jgi:hypothetical protein
MTMMLAPSKAALAGDKPDAAAASADGAQPTEEVSASANSHEQAESAAAPLVEEPSAASADAA